MKKLETSNFCKEPSVGALNSRSSGFLCKYDRYGNAVPTRGIELFSIPRSIDKTKHDVELRYST